MKIENLSMGDVSQGRYPSWCIQENTYLIQIQDGLSWTFVNAKNRGKFAGYSQFRFDDTDRHTDAFAISDKEAEKIAEILKDCAAKKLDILVHCHAGICRSGAVVEAAVACLGYEDPKRYRNPNTLVKRKLFKALGHEYTESIYEEIFYGYDKAGNMIVYDKNGYEIKIGEVKKDEG
ncbi:hypothetical protein [Synechococcus phage BUCT-ZZ01]|nr:hypothetical protein [Synechococcus phage BUCT-ZZ01]